MAATATLTPKSSASKAKAEPAPSRPVAKENSRAPAPPVISSLPAFARPASKSEGSSGGGQPLDSATLQKFEARFRRDLSQVRVHPESNAKVSSVVPGARAITIGNDIYFAGGQYSPTSEEGQQLLTHELTHTLQQESAVRVASSRMGSASDRFENEARRNAESKGNSLLSVRERTTATGAQPDEDGPGFWERQLIRVFPEVEPILKRGVFNWIQDRVLEGVQSIIDKLMAPVRTVTGIAESLSSHFSDLASWLKKAASSIAKGDCSVLHEAVDYIEQAVSGLVSPVLDKIKEVGKKIGDFFKGVWDRFGAPIWNELKKLGGKAWELIQQFGTWIWEKTKPIRDMISAAWTWVKNKLGIGEGPEGQNGLLQWVEEKAEKAWDFIKEKIEPIKKPLMVVGGILVMLSPAGPIIAVGLAVGGIIEGVRAIKKYFGTKTGVVSGRQILQTVVLPQLIKVIKGFGSLLAEKANWVIGKLCGARDSVREAARAAGESIFSFLSGLLDWIADTLDDFVKWGDDKVADFLSWVDKTASGLVGFLDRILNFLDEVAAIMKDIIRLPYLLMSKVWKAIPACIRDPFVDFFGVQILGRIAIFKALAGTPEAWAKTKAEVGVIIKEFFVDFDLTGAMKHAFKLMLRALDVPLELLEAVIGKMVLAWDTIKEKPVEFLKNLWGTIKLAFKGFFKRILTHLKNGVVGWLTKSLEGAKLEWPNDWTDLGQLFGFVMSVLGLSVDHVIYRVELKYPEAGKKLRKIKNFATGAWEWISLLARGDFKGLWEKIKGKVTNLYNMVMQGVVDWLMKQVIQGVMMQLMTTADPTGISEIVMTIVDTYRTIKTAVQYMRQILTMMNSMLDSILNIASGVLQPAADLIEDAFDRGMPVVIGFLANLVGIGDIGDSIQDILENVREKVDEGIDWLIEKAAAVIETVAGAAKSVVALLFPAEKFNVGKEQHTVTAEASENDSEIFVQSEKYAVPGFVAYARKTAKDEPSEDLESAISLLDTDYAAWKALPVSTDAEQKKKETDYKNIAKLVESVMKKLPKGAVLPTKVEWGPTNEGGGTSMVAHPLTSIHGEGQAPGATQWDIWNAVKPDSTKRKRKSDSKSVGLYVRGHLLNQQLGGPNTLENLTPITYSANSQHERLVESKIKTLINKKNKMVHYEVIADYGTIPRQISAAEKAANVIDEEGYLPLSFQTKWWKLEPDEDDPSKLVTAKKMEQDESGKEPIQNVPPYPHQ